MKKSGKTPFDCVRLDSSRQTLVLASELTPGGQRLPEIIYWGHRLSDNNTDLTALAALKQRSINHSMLDELAALSLCPEAGRAFPGHPGLIAADAAGQRWTTQFTVTHTLAGALKGTSDSQSIEIVATDPHAALEIRIVLKLDTVTDVLEASTELVNTGHTDISLQWLACPALPAPDTSDHMIGFEGRWCQEFQTQEIPWNRGLHVRENRLGRTSHEHFPGLIVPTYGASQNSGDVFGFHLGWSGNHRLLAEELPDGRRQVQFGALFEPGEMILQAQESYRTPTLYAAFSSCGLNGMSAAFHEHCRHRILQVPAWASERVVHYNCWEAIYFSHTMDTLKTIADEAKHLGAELFVLDDGWFHGRGDDTAGLGDWWPDAQKYPQGLQPLVAYVTSISLRFGLWFEPEMINRDSELYRAHPDWVLDIDAYDQVTGRHQYILDLSREDVRDYLYQSMAVLLSDHDISYVKWDMNRTQNLAAGADGRAVGVRQIQGVYALLDRLVQDFPDVMIETCSSGGGRIDFEILKRCSRVWLSDSNDAHERVTMQRNVSYFFPAEIIGSHVGPSPCHTSGRMHTMSFRGNVASGRHMGFELDPRELGQADAQALQQAITRHKKWRSLVHTATQYRIDTLDSNTVAECFVAADKKRFLLFVAQTDMQASATACPVRLPGLDDDTEYKIRLVNTDDIADSVNFRCKSPLQSGQDMLCTGSLLWRAGIILPNALPDSMWVIEGEAVS